MTEELYQILQEYARGKDGDIAKKDTPRGTPEGTPAPDQPQASAPSSKRKRRRGKRAPGDQARRIFAVEGQNSSQKTWQPKKPPRPAEGGAGRCLIHNSASHNTKECNSLIAAREEFQARMQARRKDEKAPEAPRPANIILADPAPKEENLPFQEPAHHVGMILRGSAQAGGQRGNARSMHVKSTSLEPSLQHHHPSGQVYPFPSPRKTLREYASHTTMPSS